MYYFTTLFDKNYLTRGLVMIESLQLLKLDFTLYLLCLDIATYNYFEQNKTNYHNIKLIKLHVLESYFNELKEAKNNRTTIEYYFTLSPFLPSYVLAHYKTAHICSLDADIKFYSSPKSLFEFLNDYSIVVTSHKFSPKNKNLIIFGKNNVSFQIFKNDDIGNKCLTTWQSQCLDWCHDYLDEENSRFADQKYLDNWEELYYPNLKVLDDCVSGLAVWNLNNYNIEYKDNTFYSNNEKLIFYHFHNFKILSNKIATNAFRAYKVNVNINIVKLYSDYWKLIKFKEKNVKVNYKSLRYELYNKNISEILFKERSVIIYLFKSFYYIKNINRRLNYLLRKYLLWLK